MYEEIDDLYSSPEADLSRDESDEAAMGEILVYLLVICPSVVVFAFMAAGLIRILLQYLGIMP